MKTKSCGPWLCQPAPQACASSPPRTIQEFWSLEAQIITTMWVSRNKHHSSNLVRVQSLYQPQFFCCFIILTLQHLPYFILPYWHRSLPQSYLSSNLAKNFGNVADMESKCFCWKVWRGEGV